VPGPFQGCGFIGSITDIRARAAFHEQPKTPLRAVLRSQVHSDCALTVPTFPNVMGEIQVCAVVEQPSGCLDAVSVNRLQEGGSAIGI
jgi:hypothetical protein